MARSRAAVSPAAARAAAVCALGYFVDAADVHLLAAFRAASLGDLGVAPQALAAASATLLNAQMAGMLAGAALWGALGDRLGRLKVLYGSILVYSMGTLACAFAQTTHAYALLRFVTGFGLAGETGAAVTIVAEILPPDSRAWGIAWTSAIGFLGPLSVAALSAFLPWRAAYAVFGALGLVILGLRLGLAEPELFARAHARSGPGPWRLLLRPRAAATAALCAAVGLPLIYLWSLLNFFSLELGGAAVRPGEPFRQAACLVAFYAGTGAGGALSGALSQFWRSRRAAMAAFLGAGALASAVLLLVAPRWPLSAGELYALYFVLGVSGGAWVLFTALAAELFGTDARATASIAIANAVRGFTVPMVWGFALLRGRMPQSSAAALIGAALFAAGAAALTRLPETHGTNLDFLEAAA